MLLKIFTCYSLKEYAKKWELIKNRKMGIQFQLSCKTDYRKWRSQPLSRINLCCRTENLNVLSFKTAFLEKPGKAKCWWWKLCLNINQNHFTMGNGFILFCHKFPDNNVKSKFNKPCMNNAWFHLYILLGS